MVDIEDGNEVMRIRLGKYGVAFSPVIYKNVLYQQTRDGDLYALTLEGREIWRFTTSSTTPAWAPPVFEAWETEIKIPVSKEEIRDEKKSYLPSTFGQELFESVYRTQSEYKMESPYKQKRRNY